MSEITGSVLVDHQIWALMEGKKPALRLAADRVQPASIDLVPSGRVWEFSSVPPIVPGLGVRDIIRELNDHRNSYELSHGPTLLKDVAYLVEMEGELNLPDDIYGFSSPKSTSGRNDLHCMLLVDGTTGFDEVPAGYKGKLYALVIPQSYPVVLWPGESLVQLRLFRGPRVWMTGDDVRALDKEHALVRGGKADIVSRGLMLHLDLAEASEWVVSSLTGEPVDLAKRRYYEPERFFRRKLKDENKRLHLEGFEFLLAFAQEWVSIPYTKVSAEMVAQHDSRGPFRAHTAGFIDPGFGGEEGGRLACEIRNLAKVPINLMDGQRVALLRFERLAAKPETSYGSTKAREATNYQQQGGKDRLYPKQFKESSLIPEVK